MATRLVPAATRCLLALSIVLLWHISTTHGETFTQTLRPQTSAVSDPATVPDSGAAVGQETQQAAQTAALPRSATTTTAAAKQAGSAGKPGVIITGTKPSKAGANDTYCLTATNAKAGSNTEPMSLAKCAEKADGQSWQVSFNGALSVVGTDKCLDAGEAKSKSQIVVADCQADSLSQKWFLDGIGRLHSYAAADLCVDVGIAAAKSPAQTYDDQSGFIMYECSNKLSQYFNAEGLYPPELRAAGQRIGLRANQFCLDTYDYQTDKEVSKRPAMIAQCGKSVPTQSWTYSVVNGYLANAGLQPTNTYCLQAANDTVGSAVHVMKCGTEANAMPKDIKESQQWFRDAFLRLRSYSAPSLCVEAFRASALPDSFDAGVAQGTDNMVLALNECRASTAQQWLGEQPKSAAGKQAKPKSTATLGSTAAAGRAGASYGAARAAQPSTVDDQPAAVPAVAAASGP